MLAAAQVGELPGPEVGLGVTLLFASLLAGLILCLALEEKIHAKKSVIAMVFAVVCLLLGMGLHVYSEDYLDKIHVFHLPVYIPAIEWEVITIIFGASLFVDITSKSGLFTWIAVRLTKASGGDPRKLLWYYGVLTVIFSAVLNNVTAMIIIGSLSVVSLEKLGRRDKLLGFLLVQGLLTNIGGLLTLISSVPNIIVGQAGHISFVEFFVKAALYVVLATMGTIFMGARVFRIPALEGEEERLEARRLVAGFDENDGVDSPFFFWFGAGMTVLFLGTIASASVLPVIQDLGLGFVALAFATLMLVRFKATAHRFYQAIDWDLLGFFVGLFIVINVMDHAQVLALIGRGVQVLLDLGDQTGQVALLVAAAFFSSVTDNIPLSAMLAKILTSLGTPEGDPLWWAVVFGANLGGNLTPIGSASTLVAVTIIHKQKLALSFLDFVKAALPFVLLQVLLAAGYVLWVIPLISSLYGV